MAEKHDSQREEPAPQAYDFQDFSNAYAKQDNAAGDCPQPPVPHADWASF